MAKAGRKSTLKFDFMGSRSRSLTVGGRPVRFGPPDRVDLLEESLQGLDRIRIDAELSPTALRIATTLEALEGEVPVAFGFHPWFDAPRGDHVVELPAMRRLVLDGLLPTGETVAAPAYAGPLAELDLDDGFEAVADGAVFSVTGGGRRIALRHEAGFPCAQVFAPPDKDVICFEPMTAPADAPRTGSFAVASPGRPYHAAFTIAVDRK